MQALLLHIPKGFHNDDWKHNYINVMPMGLPAIAHFANARGHGVKVMNASVHANPGRAIEMVFERIRERDVKVVGLPLHWHFSGYDVCHVAEIIKAEFPHCFVVLGGITASVLAPELMERCPAIDGIVRGDGEFPFFQLLEELEKPLSHQSLAAVPNLSWRQGDGVVHNPVGYVASGEQISDLDFGLEGVMYDLGEYANGNSMFDAMAGKPFDFGSETVDRKIFFLNIGRGCNLRCVYCAGSDVMFSRYFGRHGLALRSPEAILRTVAQAYQAGFRCFHICFDPPFPGKDDYFVEIFRRMQREVSADLKLLFETYNLPSEAFLAAAAGFRQASMVISPCFFEEEKMPRYKGYSFSRAEMETTLARIDAYPALESFVYFAVLPLDDWSLEATRRNVGYMRHLEVTYRCRASAMPISGEPGSPWMHFPSLYSECIPALGFEDFWEEWKSPLTRWSPRLCRMDDVNEVFARIEDLTRNHALAVSSAFKDEVL